MKPDSTTEKPAISTWTTVKRKARKILYLISFLVVILLAVFIYWRYFYTYSEGYRAGLLQKFSHKGTIFKTYEGELILSSVSGRSNVVIASEKFFFSVTDQNLAANLDTLQGRNVIVRYKQKIAPLIWKGDTPYYVDSVRVR
ncbi:MAG: hypothetical protein JXA72_00630 [Bacteroidales bacterium]|nr:hypothetical protein [Bacteroidales bacterium]